MCTCDPTRGQTCPPCADGIDEAEAVREGYELADDWTVGQDDYEAHIYAALGG